VAPRLSVKDGPAKIELELEFRSQIIGKPVGSSLKLEACSSGLAEHSVAPRLSVKDRPAKIELELEFWLQTSE
jgi:hypothetical protein